MATIRRYFPDFMAADEEVVEFSTHEELRRVPFVAKALACQSHHRLSFDPDNCSLMHEIHEGRGWYKLGTIEGLCELDLPPFDVTICVDRQTYYESKMGFGDPPFQDWVETV